MSFDERDSSVDYPVLPNLPLSPLNDGEEEEHLASVLQDILEPDDNKAHSTFKRVRRFSTLVLMFASAILKIRRKRASR
jgi:hypothetical protein